MNEDEIARALHIAVPVLTIVSSTVCIFGDTHKAKDELEGKDPSPWRLNRLGHFALFFAAMTLCLQVAYSWLDQAIEDKKDETHIAELENGKNVIKDLKWEIERRVATEGDRNAEACKKHLEEMKEDQQISIKASHERLNAKIDKSGKHSETGIRELAEILVRIPNITAMQLALATDQLLSERVFKSSRFARTTDLQSKSIFADSEIRALSTEIKDARDTIKALQQYVPAAATSTT